MGKNSSVAEVTVNEIFLPFLMLLEAFDETVS